MGNLEEASDFWHIVATLGDPATLHEGEYVLLEDHSRHPPTRKVIRVTQHRVDPQTGHFQIEFREAFPGEQFDEPTIVLLAQ